jgi:hypothetical protein
MRWKMNESLIRLKRSTRRVRIKDTGEYVMIWKDIITSK